jgi:hypothetical protein
VVEARCPILSSSLPAVTPSAVRGTTNAAIPLVRNAGSVVAKTVYIEACGALVMKHLSPVIV